MRGREWRGRKNSRNVILQDIPIYFSHFPPFSPRTPIAVAAVELRQLEFRGRGQRKIEIWPVICLNNLASFLTLTSYQRNHFCRTLNFRTNWLELYCLDFSEWLYKDISIHGSSWSGNKHFPAKYSPESTKGFGEKAFFCPSADSCLISAALLSLFFFARSSFSANASIVQQRGCIFVAFHLKFASLCFLRTTREEHFFPRNSLLQKSFLSLLFILCSLADATQCVLRACVRACCVRVCARACVQ